jgi:hypothetical protein
MCGDQTGNNELLLWDIKGSNRITYCILDIHVVERKVVLVNAEGAGKIVVSRLACGQGMRDSHGIRGVTRGVRS